LTTVGLPQTDTVWYSRFETEKTSSMCSRRIWNTALTYFAYQIQNSPCTANSDQLHSQHHLKREFSTFCSIKATTRSKNQHLPMWFKVTILITEKRLQIGTTPWLFHSYFYFNFTLS